MATALSSKMKKYHSNGKYDIFCIDGTNSYSAIIQSNPNWYWRIFFWLELFGFEHRNEYFDVANTYGNKPSKGR